jgi:hypothetical protein
VRSEGKRHFGRGDEGGQAGQLLLVGACAPKAQEKLFKKLIRGTGFNASHFVPVDIRGTDNKGILDRLREAVEGILKQAEAEPNPAT